VANKPRTKASPKLSPAQVAAAQRKIVKNGTRQLIRDNRRAGTYIDPKTKKPVAALQQAAAPAQQVVKLSWAQRQSALYRCRKSAYPHLIAGGLAGLGEGLYYARQLSHSVPELTLLVVTLVGGVLAALIHLVAKKARSHERLWADLAVVLGGLWLCWCTVRGLDWTLAFYLLIAEMTVALRWWPRHRHPYPTATEEVRPPGETIPVAWARYVSCKSGTLEGIPLGDYQRTNHTEAWTVPLPRQGTITVQSVYGLLDRLKHALNKPMEDLIWEQHPKLQYAGVLQVVNNSPIKKPVFFDLPRIDEGQVLLGPYADGKGEALWRTYTENGMWGGFIVGSTGSGKSRMIDQIAISLRSRGDTTIWYCDGQNGASSAPLKNSADWFVRSDQFEIMLDALEAIAHFRQNKLIVDGVPGFTPTPDYPGIMVILDESHVMARNKEWAQRLEDLAATTRKLGIAFLFSSQHSDLRIFGGLERLRSTIQEGNVIVLRLKSRIAAMLIPELTLDPTKLPKIPGYGYTVGTIDADGNKVRTAPFRGRWLLMKNEKLKHPEALHPAVEEFFEMWPHIELDAGSANHAGDSYLNRHEIARRQHERLKSQVEGGQVMTRPAKTPVVTSSLGLPPIPEFKPDSPAAQVPAEHLPDVPTDISDTEKRVFIAVAKGHDTPQKIADFLSLAPRSISDPLRNLVSLKHIDREGAGPSVSYTVAGD